MAYYIKYRFKFVDIHGTTYEVRLREQNYDGEVIDRPLGAAPVIRMQESGAFRTTCCDLVLECQVDGEYASLFTSDPRKYRVDVYRGGVIWEGFVATEIYSEPDIAPPYDVRITATDGLGTLKEYDFEPVGVKTIRYHLETFLVRTGMELTIYSVHSIRQHGNYPVNFLDDTQISLDYHAGHSIYEALEDLLKTMRCFITQCNGYWLIVRESDVTVNSSMRIPCFVTSGTHTQATDFVDGGAVVGQMGAVGTNMWPIGFLTKTVRPAKKSVKVRSAWHLRSGAPDVSSNGWTIVSNAVFTTNRYTLGSYSNPGSIYAQLNPVGFVNGLRIAVKASRVPNWQYGQGRTGAHIQVSVAWYSTGDSAWHYYDADSGSWGTSQGSGMEANVDRTNEMNDVSFCESHEFKVPAADDSYDGILKVTVGGVAVDIYDVSVLLDLGKGYEDTILIDNEARGVAEDLEISGGRNVPGNMVNAYFADGVFFNANTHSIITSFDDADNSDLDYLSLTALNYAKEHAEHRLEYTGTLNFPQLRYHNPIALLFNGVVAILESFEWNLKEAEFRFKAVTKPTAVLTVDSETITSLPDD